LLNTAFVVIAIFFFRVSQSNDLVEIKVISLSIIDPLNDKKQWSIVVQFH